MKHFVYTPKGVCSKQIDFDLDGSTVRNLKFTYGCNGNTSGISSLVEGMDAKEVIARLRGINCNGKGTSCPDQLAHALEQAIGGC